MFGVLIALALTTAKEPMIVQADLTAANAWVSLIDAKRWDDSWNAAGSLFKSKCRNRVGLRPFSRSGTR